MGRGGRRWEGEGGGGDSEGIKERGDVGDKGEGPEQWKRTKEERREGEGGGGMVEGGAEKWKRRCERGL